MLQYAGVDTMNATGPAPTAASRETSWKGQTGSWVQIVWASRGAAVVGVAGAGMASPTCGRVIVVVSFDGDEALEGAPATVVDTRWTPGAGNVITSG